MALKQLFVGVAEAIGADIVGALYYPTLFGVAGALISGYVTLDRHTTKLRDFDPIHISWYLFNPLLGGVMGLFTFRWCHSPTRTCCKIQPARPS